MLDGSRVLITQSVFSSIGGSEVQAFELAQYLRSRDCQVTLYSWMCSSPMSDILRENGFRVLAPETEESASLSLRDFDIIWVQHETLPVRLLEELADNTDHANPLMIFSHMSPYREVYIEHPYVFDLEANLADVIVFNAPSTRDAQKSEFRSCERMMLYPNPAPLDYVASKHVLSNEMHKILVVSNHPPKELREAMSLLSAKGYQVDMLIDAIGAEKPSITSADLLDCYDCVISIGKTVQYCLVQGIPVFLYDHFGGPGYLNETNFELAEYYNFSGRFKPDGCSLQEAKENAVSVRQTPEVLASAIENGYADAVTFQTSRRREFIDRYSIDSAFGTIYERGIVEKRNKKISDKVYGEYLVKSQKMIGEYVVTHRRLANPNAAFYKQTIRSFVGEGYVFAAGDALEQKQRLRKSNSITIPVPCGKKTVRVDFGDSPCVVTDLKVDGIERRCWSNSSLEMNGTYFFLDADPQIVIHVGDSVNTGKEGILLNVSANVYPLNEIPREVEIQCMADIHDMTERLRRIQDSRWWKLHEKIKPVISPIQKVIQAVRSFKR